MTSVNCARNACVLRPSCARPAPAFARVPRLTPFPRLLGGFQEAFVSLSLLLSVVLVHTDCGHMRVLRFGAVY